MLAVRAEPPERRLRAVAVRPGEQPATARKPAATPAEPTASAPQQPATAPAPYNPVWHAALGALNRVFMVPALRAGLGPLLVSPVGGYFMMLVTRGRRSGRPRFAPLNYTIVDGNVYCLAGFGERTHWLRNLRADARADLRLPGRRIGGIASVVTDASERALAAREVLKAGGFAGFLAGCNPWTAPDAVIERCLAGVPLVRVCPETSLERGPFDPGGRGWIPVQALMTAATIGMIALLRGFFRGARPAVAGANAGADRGR